MTDVSSADMTSDKAHLPEQVYNFLVWMMSPEEFNGDEMETVKPDWTGPHVQCVQRES